MKMKKVWDSDLSASMLRALQVYGDFHKQYTGKWIGSGIPSRNPQPETDYRSVHALERRGLVEPETSVKFSYGRYRITERGLHVLEQS